MSDGLATKRPDADSLPSEASVVVIGGGVAGTSVAYHLAKAGFEGVLLLERQALASGTTWHAAGLVGRLRTSNSLTKVNKYSAELYSKLEAETGLPTGWNQVGSVMIGRSEARMQQLLRTAAMSERFGVESEVIDPDRVRELWPLVRVDDILGGVWLEGDGRVQPEQLTRALAKGAIDQGATVFEELGVRSLRIEHGRVVGVETDHGSVRCEHVVLCGGMWTREFGLRHGVSIPLFPVEHHYVVSNEIEGVHENLPVARDPDLALYFRPEGRSIVLGAFQERSTPWSVPEVPSNFRFQLLESDWGAFEKPLRDGKHLIPALEHAEFPKFVNGPESFTPDNSFLLGETQELRGLFVACGFNSAGIACAGGAGRAIAQWIEDGQAPMDLWSVDIQRFSRSSNQRKFLSERVSEVLGLHYQMAWPNREMETARGVRHSALHEKLAEEGACFGQKMNWERPLWFAGKGKKPKLNYSFDRPDWLEASGAEHRAARESVALFDQSSFSRYVYKGPDACRNLQRICGNDVDVEPGRIVYTGLFNERGRFESDLTVVRILENEYFIVTATAQTIHDFDWIERRTEGHATLVDVTSGFGTIGLMGPRARDVLERVTDADVSHEAFPFGTAKEIAIGLATARAMRVTYVGELGWELHIPTEMMRTAYESLLRAGEEFDLRLAGHYAVNSLRLEKGYRAWGLDISPDETPVEAGLGFVVAWDKEGGFIGRDALLPQRTGTLTRRIASYCLEDPSVMLWGAEPIYRDGVSVGYTTSAAYGHTLGGAVALGYVNGENVTRAFVREGSYEIGVAGRRVPARVSLWPFYDPKRERILC
ncbi:MAG: FAD-dependent oxidoreductase [Planctomycetota bacterium]